MTTKALFFDIFGTCVDWRKTVTDTLFNSTKEALDAPDSSIPDEVRSKASSLTYSQWGSIAQEWRNSYLKFTRSIAADPSLPYKTVDQHHLDSLQDLLSSHGLEHLFTPSEIQTLSLIWHYLAPWPDTVRGLSLLNTRFATCTLSNGNLSLLTDMVSHSHMPFTHIFSAEMFHSYKPSPKVYLGAAEKMGLRPEECMMVAAHLDDLKFAKKNGLRTCYVEREGEEREPSLKEEGFVDVWVGIEEEGFVAAARKLGIEG